MPRSLLFVSLCLTACSSMAQQPPADEGLAAFRAELKGRVILQAFSADPVTNFEWTNGGLTVTPPNVRTFGVYSFKSVNLHKDSVELTGSRSTYLRGKDGKPELFGAAPATIKIALNGADPAQVLPQLKSLLFFPSIESAIDAIPVQYRQILPASTEARPKNQPPHLPYGCSASGQAYKPPVVTTSVDPEFSAEARRHAPFQGDVTIAFTVDEHGHPVDLWLARPLGLDLDEQAIKAVAQYTFKPATCDGVAIKGPLMIEVSFQIM